MAVFVESRLYRGGVPGRMIAVLVVVGLPSFLARSSHSTVLWERTVILTDVLRKAPVIITWNTAEFIAICVRKSSGIPAVYHVWADGILFAGIATTTGIVLVNLIIGIATFGPAYDEPLGKGIVEVAMLLLLM